MEPGCPRSDGQPVGGMRSRSTSAKRREGCTYSVHISEQQHVWLWLKGSMVRHPSPLPLVAILWAPFRPWD